MKPVHDTPRITDAELVRLIRNGQRKGAAALYDNYAAFLYLVIHRILPDRRMAESALTGVIGEIWNSVDDYNLNKERIYTWMMGIARKTALAILAESERKHETNIENI